MGTLDGYTYRNCTREGEKVEGEKRRDADPAGAFYPFVANWRLLKISIAIWRDPAALEAIGARSDGYGRGMPPSGYDWSGIRDSSPESVDAMYAIASEWVSDAELSAGLGLEVVTT